MDETTLKVSGKKMLITLLAVFVVALFGFGALIYGVTAAKYVVYLAVPIGAALAIVGALGIMSGHIKKDF